MDKTKVFRGVQGGGFSKKPPWSPKAIVILLTLLLFVWCGKQSSEVRIVAFGDSTTAFREDVGKVYSQRLSERFSTMPTRLTFKFFNAGVPGDTTEHGRARFERDVLDREPHVTIIQFGLNDSCIDVYKGKTQPRLSLRQYENNLIYFIRSLREQKSNVILMTPNPMIWTTGTLELWGKPPYDTKDPLGFNLLNKEYAESVRRVARDMKVPLVDVYRLFTTYGEKEGRAIGELLSDGIHPNDNGHRMITSTLLPVLKQSIRHR
ncbi:MAG: hypothetical protein GY940_14865 [bacterium]|nr:hypothetical protein [bacterium]